MSEYKGVPLFQPKEGSSVVKYSLDCRRTVKSKLLYPLVYAPGAWLIKHPIIKPKPAPVGPQQFLSTLKKVLQKYPDVQQGVFPLSNEVRDDPRFNLQQWELLTVTPKANADDVKCTVLYFPGGAFIQPAIPDHAHWMARLSKRLHARFIFVPYELAPNASAASTAPRIVKIFEQVWLDAKLRHGHQVIVSGERCVAGPQ